MNTSQIHLALSHWDSITRKYFIGVYSEDQLPKRKIERNKFCLIFNTHSSTQPGEHWISLYIYKTIDNIYRIEYFDSLGRSPYSVNVINFLKMYADTWAYNSNILQGPTKVCAQYCIMFLVLRCRNVTFENILQYFTVNREINDRIVFDFVCKRFKFLC